jgi:hypothetical protein
MLHLNRVARSPPLRKALTQAPGPDSVMVQQSYRLIGIDTVRPSALGHYLHVLWQFGQPSLEVFDRDRARGGNVTLFVLQLRADIYHDDGLIVEQAQELDRKSVV